MVVPSHDEILVGLQLANQIHAAIHGRNTIYVGRTVGDFKRALERLGVRDSDDLSSIEFGTGRYSSGYIHVEWDEQDGIEIREVSK